MCGNVWFKVQFPFHCVGYCCCSPFVIICCPMALLPNMVPGENKHFMLNDFEAFMLSLWKIILYHMTLEERLKKHSV